VTATQAACENGLLHIDLVREVPEAQKPRAIPIQASAKAIDVKAATPESKQAA
jgi:molecular chaperone IbpA